MKNTLKKNAITFAITLAAAGSIFGVVAYNGSQMVHAAPGGPPQKKAPMKPVAEEVAPQALPQVAVQTTQAGSYQAEVIGYGEPKARYELDFASEVSGRVEWLSEEFEAGRMVKKGTLLAKLDDTSYQQAYAQAKSDVATAQLELLEEQREGEQARSEWQRSGLSGEPSSPLVLREPQLASAKANLENAKRALKTAQDDLADTKVYAPFDGVIVSRDIQPGSYLNSGGSIAKLYSVDRVEIEIPLSEKQWSNLPKQTPSNWSATITDSTGQHEWQAKVERSYQYVEQETRQRSIVLTIENPLEQSQPLFPGTFVQANILGESVDDLWQLPASSLSQQDEIWTVDKQGLLVKNAADTVFERGQYVYVKPTQQSENAQVVMRPLSNFKIGMKVMPIDSSNNQLVANHDVASHDVATTLVVGEEG